MSQTIYRSKTQVAAAATVGSRGSVAVLPGGVGPEVADLGHHRSRDAVFLGGGTIGQRAGANVGDLGWAQLCLSAFVARRRSRSSSGDAIGNVVCVRTEHKVSRVATWWVVAGVTHHEPGLDRTVRDGVGGSMSLLRAEMVPIAGPVTKVALPGEPRPAHFHRTLVNFRPEVRDVTLVHGHNRTERGHNCQ